MKKIKYLFILFMFFCIGFSTKVNAYNVGEYVYYDPYNHKHCDINDYWTIYNQESTCYRWAIIQTGIKEQSQAAVRLLLDHDIGVSNFNDRTKVYNEAKQKWNDPNILKISTLGNQMVLGLYKGNYTKNNEWNKKNPTETYYLKRESSRNLLFVYSNTLFYYNGNAYYDYKYNKGEHKGGYWISHSDTDNDPFENPETIGKSKLAYYITSDGNIQLSSIEDKRGVRPTIYIKESALSNSSYEIEKINLKQNIADGELSNLEIDYRHNAVHNHKFFLKSNHYFYPQGFSFYNENSFLVYMMHKNEEGYTDKTAPGILLQYKNGNFNHVGNYEYGHGNDISITSNNTFYINNSKDSNIMKFDLPTLKAQPINNAENKSFYYGAFTFDSNGNYFYGADGSMRIVVRDAKKDYKKMYSFDSPILETLQSLAYNNGYLYIATYEVPKTNNNNCNKSYQLYCYGEDRLTTIYVYNVKFDSNGKPSKFFGKLVKKYITNNINTNDDNSFYEIEGISVIGNNLLLGYAKKSNEKYFPSAYSYQQNHNVLTYKKGDQIATDNIITGTYIDLQNPFKYNANEDFVIWKTDQGTVNDNSIIKIDKNITLTSIYAEFEKGSLKNNKLKISLNKDFKDFNSKNICHNCKFKSTNVKKFIGTGNKVEIYVDNNKLKEYEVIVTGDVTGTGTSDVSDVARLYQYLKKKIDMSDCYKEAGNVVGTDNEITIADVAKLYQFIKGKISSLEV